MTRAAMKAIKDMLTASGLTVVDGGGSVPEVGVVLWISPPAPSALTIADLTGHREIDLTAHAVGVSAEQASWASEKVTTALAGVRPALSNWTCSPLRMTASLPIQIDPDSAAPVWFTTLRFVFTATPA